MNFFESSFQSVDELIQMLSELESETEHHHKSENAELLTALDNTTFKYASLALALMEHADFHDKEKFYHLGCIISISNNSLAIKRLFTSGLHFQMQVLMRSQFEQLNILVAALYDSEFFKKFTIAIPNRNSPVSPKYVDTERIIRRIFTKVLNSKDSWETIKPIMDRLYSEFSEATHGNLLRATLHSMEPTENETLTFSLGGSQTPLAITIDLLSSMNNYCQLLWRLINTGFQGRNYLDGKQSKDHTKISSQPAFLLENGQKLST